jgi:hypothetical protein
MRGIKSAVPVLVTTLILSAGLTVTTASPASAKAHPVTLHKGNDAITLTWVSRPKGAGFIGTIGNLSVEGVSKQSAPHSEIFHVAGQLEGKTNFTLLLSLIGAKPTELTFRATGKVGASNLRGKVEIALPASATGDASLSLTGTLGTMAISGTIPLPADTTDHVSGEITLG